MAETKVFDKFAGIGVASGFKLQAKAPLDGRLTVDTIEDRNKLVTENGAYEGMKVYVKSVGISYALNGTTNSDWKTDGVPVVKNINECDAIATNDGAYQDMIVYVEDDHEFYNFIEQGATWDKQANAALGGFLSNGFAGIDEVTQGLIDIEEVIAGSEEDFINMIGGDSIIDKLDEKLSSSAKGTAGGVAELDETGKVPTSQLPSYVDDVVEGYLSAGKLYKEAAHTTEITGESGKIYVDLATNKTYRWSGTAFVEISSSLALGETASSAYRGDRGKIAYDHSQAAHAPANAERNVIVGVQKNGTDVAPDANRKVNIEVPTKVSQLANDAGYVDGTIATTSNAGLMSAADKAKVDALPSVTVSTDAPTTATTNSLWLRIDPLASAVVLGESELDNSVLN